MRSAPQRPTITANTRSAARETSRPLRFVQVGLGEEGLEWLRNPQLEVQWMACVPTSHVTGEFDVDATTTPVFADLADALSNVRADAAFVTTPIEHRAAVVREALEADLHVLVDKPFAASMAEAHDLVRLAKARGRVLMVNQHYRFAPAPRLAARLLREGSLGALGAVHVTFRSDRGRAYLPGQPEASTSHPLLLDMAAHHFDLMRLVLGQDALEVSCRTWNPPWSPYLDAASVSAAMLFEGGTVVTYEGTLVTSAPITALGGEWRLECEAGEVYFTSRGDRSRGSADRLIVRSLGGRARIIPLPRLTSPDRAGVLAAFTAAIRTGSEAESSGALNLGSLALSLGAIRSAEVGCSVRIPEWLESLHVPEGGAS